MCAESLFLSRPRPCLSLPILLPVSPGKLSDNSCHPNMFNRSIPLFSPKFDYALVKFFSCFFHPKKPIWNISPKHSFLIFLCKSRNPHVILVDNVDNLVYNFILQDFREKTVWITFSVIHTLLLPKNVTSRQTLCSITKSKKPHTIDYNFH